LGIRVEKLNGDVLYDQNAASVYSRSNMKIYTTAAALEILGPDFRYQTRLEAWGEINSDGALKGNLLIIGSGDPSLGSWRFGKNADTQLFSANGRKKVKEVGISEVSGAIIGDGRVFTEEYYAGGWEYETCRFGMPRVPAARHRRELFFALLRRPVKNSA